MKKHFLILLFLAVSVSAFSQVQLYQKEKTFTEQDSKTKFHTVSGERHGTSFFKKFEFPEVEYQPTDKLTFDNSTFRL
jgi:hypothetical protein